MTKNNSKQQTFDRLFKSLGIKEEDIKKETSDQVMIPKMALIGVLETIEHVCDSLKYTIITSPARLEVGLIKMYLSAITSSSVFALKLLKNYEQAYITKPSPTPVDPYSPTVTETEALSLEEEEKDSSEKEPHLELVLTPEDLAELEQELSEEDLEDDEETTDDFLKGFLPVNRNTGSGSSGGSDPKKQN